MVEYEDMTADERDRFIYLMLNEDDLKAIVLIMKEKYGTDVTLDDIMKFAFKVARNKMIPREVRDKFKNKNKNKTKKSSNNPSDIAMLFSNLFNNYNK
ncbi:MAG: hypothetical protein JXB50_05290 [Spirochaetes bacterium]|nr:hypothetical protein [Spirochaetota bacterium]